MYEVYVAAAFEAAHRLKGNFGPAARTHGHTYRLEALVRGERLAEDGTLLDIGGLRETVSGIAATLDYRDLDEVPGLAGKNTTAEVVAGFCWDRISPSLRGRGLDSLTVRVWESSQVYAAREGALG
ncbi:MAG: 6-carboxytetrahydropterin synthase [Actinomycetota bacterium]|nr:6-carboxytetrahydropterin synthase [Actinomycetota bacterium]